MADEPQQEPLRKEWRLAIGVIALAFNGAIVWWCLVAGKSENLLHQNALSWAFILSTVVLAGLGFGSIISSPAIQAWIQKR